MRRDDGSLRSVPRLPSRLRRPASTLQFLGRRPRVEVTADRATYRLRSGAPLTVRHHGAEPTVREGAPVERPLPVPRSRPAPEQPLHRGRARAERRRPSGAGAAARPASPSYAG
ncbi:glycosyl hydrolase family 65 protein [Streptomyces pimonensis]|uniref:glycosyl hydrolase family 65 protein n=1 Tax=Streptomyces pimonensis TaxID=2860288 RepID=UPI0035280280